MSVGSEEVFGVKKGDLPLRTETRSPYGSPYRGRVIFTQVTLLLELV